MIDNFLIKFANNPEDEYNNIDLAFYYDSIGQTASAVSFYLRAAERTKSKMSQYECMLRAGLCFSKQGCRSKTVEGLFQHALTIMPHRPEGYYLLSRFYEKEGNHQDGYLIASIGQGVADLSPKEKLNLKGEYPGEYGILFQKAVSAWWVGLCKESMDIFEDLLENYDLDPPHLQAVKNNIENLSEKSKGTHWAHLPKRLRDFKWGIVEENEWFKKTVEKEVFIDNVYQKFFDVEENDVVFDIGASVGSFTYLIQEKNPSKVYCFEPHDQSFKTLRENVESDNIICIGKAIGENDGEIFTSGCFDVDYVDGNQNYKTLPSVKFSTFIKENNIEKIDFLKCDCEGGEYEIFNDENLPWIKQNVRKIAGEWHLDTPELEKKFQHFRDTYLKEFPNFRLESWDYVDMKWAVWDALEPDGCNWFIKKYQQINLWIDNTEKKSIPVSLPTSHGLLVYNKENHSKLRYKFPGSETINKNYSQVFQDMFVLTMLNGKKNGIFLEIGGARPYYGNNTALLEESFGWNGFSIEFDKSFADEYIEARPTNVICQDALTVDYKALLSKSLTSNIIDYLQLDIDPPKNTYECLLKIPFDEYKFRVITYEHDYYVDPNGDYRQKSREYLKSLGYELVVSDVAPDEYCSFEDWWVHPDYVDAAIIQMMKSVTGDVQKADDYFYTQTEEKWKVTQWPTLEFTTSIPEKGCVVDCAFCPQRTLEKTYTGQRIMTFENFKDVIDKLPKEVRVTFAGFTEPWLNRNCTDMALYAHEMGHQISVFTTGIGMKVEDVYRLKDIPYAGNPNGGFVLHLPDQERIAKHPITSNYIKVLEAFKEVHGQIQNFYTMAMGPVHNDVKHIFPQASVPEFWSRAGNLLGEAMMKPELLNLKDRFKSIYHGEKPKTCGCVEDLYHNIVLPNGDVSLCCMDYSLKHILGNIYEQGYNDIIPKQKTCFDMCRFCENGVDP